MHKVYSQLKEFLISNFLGLGNGDSSFYFIYNDVKDNNSDGDGPRDIFIRKDGKILVVVFILIIL